MSVDKGTSEQQEMLHMTSKYMHISALRQSALDSLDEYNISWLDHVFYSLQVEKPQLREDCGGCLSPPLVLVLALSLRASCRVLDKQFEQFSISRNI